MEIQKATEVNATPKSSIPSGKFHKRATRFTDDFSEEIFNVTYKFAGEMDINDRHLAIARDLASVETPALQDLWTDRFLDLLADFKFLPGGRITSNAGTGLQGTTFINCFVSGFRGENQDSMESIMDELKRQALILKSEGGYGFCADVMRPRGAYVSGIGGESPGAVKLLEMWDTQSSVITAGSGKKKGTTKGKNKIRKGAQMVTMSIWHPDIEEFISAKQTPGRLTKFNMSVLVSDDFMTAVETNQPWHLQFPDIELAKSDYQKLWDGNLGSWKKRGLPVVTTKTFTNANDLWDLLMRSTYSRNEPGVLFIDTINKMNNLSTIEHINATNPCGEQVLPVGGACLLGSLNLTQFVDLENQNWNYTKLSDCIRTAVRLMDNVNDRTTVPLLEQKESLKSKRRIGLGYLGYGSALMMLKVRYGSPLALDLSEQLGTFLKNEAYQASSFLALEKGSFPLFEAKTFLQGKFIQTLSSETRNLIAHQGLRNSHLLSIQPTGNSSVLANNVSGGLEPLFMTEYIRTVVQAQAPEGLGVPNLINWENKTFSITGPPSPWYWIREGGENILQTEFENAVWKFDSSRGLLKETQVKDFAVRFHQEHGTWDPSADWAATAFDLNIDDHVRTMKVLSRAVDSAMSKTVNIPENYPYNDFKRLYQDIFKTGTIKGCTSYRAGTMLAVLSAPTIKARELIGVPRTRALPRPQSLECDVHQLTSAGFKWTVLVGLLGQDPYEVFALKQSSLHLPPNLKTGRLVKEKSGLYHLETNDGWILRDVRKFFESDEQEALTRMISTALRHGAYIEFIVSQLIKSEGTITSFAKAIARTLKTYVQQMTSLQCGNCGSHNLKLQEGCFVCADCGGSKCE